MSNRRTHTLIAITIVAGIALLLAAIAGLWGFMSVTSTPIHASPQDVPSVALSVQPAKWSGAVERGRQIARAAVADQNLPGLSVAVGIGGDIVWAEGFGWSDLEERVRVTPRTRFRIGTASTALTSAAAGLLLEKGSLKLDEKIQTYVPGFPEKQWPVTLRQLMAHVGGVRSDAGDEENVTAHCERTADALPRFAQERLRFEPGTQYRYSTYGWILVSAAIEAAAGEPFFTFIRKQIFEPLDMADTKVDSTTDSTADRAIYYFPRFAADPRYGPQPPSDVDYSCFSGASAFLSTPSDLVRFGIAIDSGKLLQPDTVRLLQAPQRLASGQETGYGLGWDLESVTLAGQPRQLVVHDGELRGGMVASVISFPERGIVVAVTSNISYADTASIASRLTEVFAESRLNSES